jgi:hypothetical protein
MSQTQQRITPTAVAGAPWKTYRKIAVQVILLAALVLLVRLFVAAVSKEEAVSEMGVGTAAMTGTGDGQGGMASMAGHSAGLVCKQAGSVVTLTGSQGVFDKRNALAAGTVIDARVASWLAAGNIPMRFGGGSDICLEGALIQGTYPNSTSWDAMHDTYAIQPFGPRPVVQGVRVHNYGDGVFPRGDADGWIIRGSWFSFMRDDCIQNDHLYNGLVEDALYDGCYVFYSARRYSASRNADGSANTVKFRNVLVRLQPMPTVYKGPAPGHGKFWKLDRGGVSPMIALENVIFRVDQASSISGGHMMMIPPATHLAQCNNVTLVWLGNGDFPETVPPCYTVTRDRAVWDDAVASWHAAHPEVRDTVAVTTQ